MLSDALTANDLTWISGAKPHCNWVYGAKTRYRQKDAPCEVERVDADSCEIKFAEPQWAVTPGQSAVLYNGDVHLRDLAEDLFQRLNQAGNGAS